MNQQKYGIFFNINAGDGKAEQAANQLKEKLSEAGITGCFITGKSETESIARLAEILDTLDALIAIGGDGTLSLAITALLKANKSIPFGIIPAGTVNNFAKRFQIPLEVEAAIAVIVAGCQQSVGIGKCDNGQAIVSSLALGNLADLSNEVRQKDKQRFGKIVYFIEALRRIGKNKSYRIEYQIDGQVRKELKTWFALLTTTSSIGGHIYSDPAPTKLHLSVLNNISFSQIIPYIYFGLTGKLNHSKAITYLTMNELKLSSKDGAEVIVRIDGDKGPALPIQITYLEAFLSLFVP
ncbi:MULTISPECIES: YegS/Rv2252/BmrU family lipid kinase [unclassified Enterococcus]|uniref:diacylglycerol/lipid kinase family protein n=1 Tax=unclassified Enterococcus TaxID=2608891 RepID=UPI001554C31A|nr:MULTISPECIES: YegS/Rv2252/BmrU family lipid kinase [unclassified Enterococcus]MBS7577446.1 YegS/Rv2252/BmrU family lipid kinase [Enterococcus sp. MMGLQ5-2]MBS7584853.1 YegS/Rv2252/BmrU family lipid kinase [Enterococcus sp. MMGLQ5-1]NPD12708.1 YegS/Rv2252/BmrU family lipid kinase [Enterococcus sp. MMGLQ5-1]NPD37280.1 YegS/Rv2252/BmrU family lipid kinase [Enterococcus sp. MMGLQ5-2]